MIIYHGAVVHSDNDGVRKIFQVVYVHSTYGKHIKKIILMLLIFHGIQL